MPNCGPNHPRFMPGGQKDSRRSNEAVGFAPGLAGFSLCAPSQAKPQPDHVHRELVNRPEEEEKCGEQEEFVLNEHKQLVRRNSTCWQIAAPVLPKSQ